LLKGNHLLELLLKYFPELTDHQQDQFAQLQHLYSDWNSKINVISRKDIDELYLRHVLHSLGIAKVQPFKEGCQILDVGTGGGFPGIPLAIMFPQCQFYLVDSIGKKLKVINAVSDAIGLTNVGTMHSRAEALDMRVDFIVSRAVTYMPTFVGWVKNKVSKKSNHDLKNGILYLKGGELKEELSLFPKAKTFQLSTYFSEPFFETKKVVHIPLKYKP